MKNVFSMVNDFVKGLSGVFIGLVALVILASFFTNGK